MGANSEISWTDHTFNPWIGCMKVSPACDSCYAENLMDTRLGQLSWGAPGKGEGTRRLTSPQNWRQPRKWDRWARNEGVRRFVFCASLADVFDNAVPIQWRRELFALIQETPNLNWLLLTKRPQNIVKMITDMGIPWPQNAWAGASIEDRIRLANNGICLNDAKWKLDIPKIFWSCEPLLEDLGDLTGILPDWVITGGETDQGSHRARPSNPDWFRSIRNYCMSKGVPFHHKQNGEFVQFGEHGILADGSMNFLGRPDDVDTGDRFIFGDVIVQRVGKKHAGRYLDGLIHSDRPGATP